MGKCSWKFLNCQAGTTAPGSEAAADGMQGSGREQGLTHTAEGQIWNHGVHDDIVGCHATTGGL